MNDEVQYRYVNAMDYLRGDDVRQVVVAHCRSCCSAAMTSCKSVSIFKAKYSDEESCFDVRDSQMTAMVNVPSISSALAGHTWAPSDTLSRHRTNR